MNKKKPSPLSVRLPAQVQAALRDRAAQEQRPTNRLVCEAVAAYLSNRKSVA